METLGQMFHVQDTAEAIATLKAIDYIVSEINLINVTVHGDSLSTPTSLQNYHNPRHRQENPKRSLYCTIFWQKTYHIFMILRLWENRWHKMKTKLNEIKRIRRWTSTVLIQHPS